MPYKDMLKSAIETKEKSLSEIAELLNQHGFKTKKAYLSKLQNGKVPPAGDELNHALALVLEVSPVELKAAAYREKIPADVLAQLNNPA